MSDRRPLGEFERIDRIRDLIPGSQRDVVIGSGDDCAAVVGQGGLLTLLTCDAMVEGRHYTAAHTSPADLGRKLAAINLSDIAAMGGSPRFALLSLVVPLESDESWTVDVAAGVSEVLASFGAALVGGNLSGTEGPMVADLTMIGEVEPDRVVRRAGARAGDVVMVTGDLGGSAAAVRWLAAGISRPVEPVLLARHMRPTPRVRIGRIIAESGLATAMIDLSDGLVSDLAHVCRAGDVSAEIDVERIPCSDAVRRAADTLGTTAVELAVAGGEDYELLFTATPHDSGTLRERIASEAGVPVTEVGRIVNPGAERPGVRCLDANGDRIDLPSRGWDHFSDVGTRTEDRRIAEGPSEEDDHE